MSPHSSDGSLPDAPRAVFMGTPAAAIPVLAALRRVADVVLVVTRPDKPRGRSKRLKPPPVTDAAVAWDLRVAQPSSDTDLLELVESVSPDVAIVAAYGRLIRAELLEVPPHGFVNVHYSLLPRWRGASPVVRAILAGDAETGASLMKMDTGLDTGPLIATAVVSIQPDHDTSSLTGELAAAGGDLLASCLPAYLGGRIAPVPQDDARATAAAKVTTDEAHVDPVRHSSEAVGRAVRAFNPKPGAWCLVDGERFKIWSTAPGLDSDWTAGRAQLTDGRVILGTRTGAIELLMVQPAGKQRMPAIAWMNGRRGEDAELS